MLCDRCKTSISDHLFQELSQDANNDLQNTQGRAQYPKRCLGYVFGFQSYLLRGCLDVSGISMCFGYLHILWLEKSEEITNKNDELKCHLLWVDR